MKNKFNFLFKEKTTTHIDEIFKKYYWIGFNDTPKTTPTIALYQDL